MTRRARRGVEVRREEILAATTELLDRIGLAATRVADVAEALGVSPALVFYHFGTKDALVAEAFAHAVERDLSRLDAATDARHRPGRPAAPGAAALRPDRRGRRLAALDRRLGAGPARAGDPQGAAPHGPALVRGAAARSSSEGVADGAFTCPDPAASVARVSALLDGLSVATLVYRTVTRAQLRAWVAERGRPRARARREALL